MQENSSQETFQGLQVVQGERFNNIISSNACIASDIFIGIQNHQSTESCSGCVYVGGCYVSRNGLLYLLEMILALYRTTLPFNSTIGNCFGKQCERYLVVNGI
mmetsp:Transcript_36601/g.114252  ORF Transcript_36601/g.114252 Transcript_36601/m.114252 type:complete len:103 (-) Transcript_36601:169-477(-)